METVLHQGIKYKGKKLKSSSFQVALVATKAIEKNFQWTTVYLLVPQATTWHSVKEYTFPLGPCVSQRTQALAVDFSGGLVPLLFPRWSLTVDWGRKGMCYFPKWNIDKKTCVKLGIYRSLNLRLLKLRWTPENHGSEKNELIWIHPRSPSLLKLLDCLMCWCNN